MSASREQATRGRTQALIAGALHLCAYVGLAYGRELAVSWFYQIAWWTYILAVDGLVYARRGDSLFRSRPWEAALLSLLSVLVWFHFETWNVHLDNWFYVRAVPDFANRVLHYTIAFATVLPGVFETYDLLDAYRVPRRVRVRPLQTTPAVWRRSYATGIACVILPLLWPEYAFPLVWGVFIFLLDPVNARWGGSSFIQDWGRGDLTRLCRLLLAGFVCGGLWESWNYWVRAKWMYTVPFFGGLKIFEMPVLGFLGFPPFAVELWCIATFVTLLRGVPGWRGPRGEPASVGPRLPRWAWLAVWVAGVLYSAGQLLLTDRYTVNSLYLPLSRSLLVETEAGRTAIAAGFVYPDQVAAAGRAELARRVGIPESEVGDALGPVLVAALPGVGTEAAYKLARLDIRTLDQLAAADARVVAESLPHPKPPVRRVELWIAQAEAAVESGMMRGIYAR